jgi:hypothetical protein
MAQSKQISQVITEATPPTYSRVRGLEYQIQTPPNFEYEGRKQGSIGTFTYTLDHFHALFFPGERYEDADAAREALEPLLEVWQIHALVIVGKPFTLAYIGCDIETEPSTNDPAKRQLARPCAGKLSVVLRDDQFPPTPSHWEMTECARDLAAHYSESIGSRRTLLMHAYAMYTRLVVEYGTPRKAALAMRISEACLDKLKRLSSTRSSGNTARKYKKGMKIVPLDVAEDAWLRGIMRQIVHRSVGVASEFSPDIEITLATTFAP